MVKLKNGKRYCSCGRVIKNNKHNICHNCINIYKLLKQKAKSQVDYHIQDFIQLVKYECGYTLTKPKGIYYE